AQILAAREPRGLRAEAPERALEALRVGASEVADAVQPERHEPLARHGPDAREPLDRQRVEELAHALRRHLEQAVWLREVARDLRDQLHRRDPDRDREPGLGAHRLAQAAPGLGRRAEEARGPGEVEEGLVEREPFDERREAAEDLEDALGLARVAAHVAAQED